MADDGSEQARPALIALDWGTTRLRAWTIAAGGEVLSERREDWGLQNLPDGGFGAALAAIAAQDGEALPVIACGMVGSRHGLAEAPYLELPATLDRLAHSLTRTVAGGIALSIVPGLLDRAAASGADVLRGEETLAVGALARLAEERPDGGGSRRNGDASGRRDGDAMLLMPGTHSKWLRVGLDGTMRLFFSSMTGELHHLLMRHSILGRLASDAAPEALAGRAAFRLGVLAAQAEGAPAALFSARALPLTGGLRADCVGEYVSGLLIGDELRSGLARARDVEIVLVGDAAIGARYADAFEDLGAVRPPLVDRSAPAGLYRIARMAGLLG